MSDAELDPIARFAAWLADAKRADAAAGDKTDDTPMTLATADARGRPSARMVLLKHVDARGFVFHTNRRSRKGVELGENAFAALCFHWPRLERQVRVEGAVSLLPDDESDAYFATRSRGSQIGAWASDQSHELATREALEARTHEVALRFPGAVPRPPHWGGYLVAPSRVEFWQGQPSRLHDREVYDLDKGGYRLTRLMP